MRALVLTAALLAAMPAMAQEEPTDAQAREASGLQSGTNSGRPLPRFEALRNEPVNLRQGPGINHQVLWQYKRQNLPVQVIAESDTWRLVKDWEGQQGWVLSSMLTHRRYVLVTKGKNDLNAENAQHDVVELRLQPESDATPVARVEEGKVAQLLECQQGWCRVAVDAYAGWLPRVALWGVGDKDEGKVDD